MNLSAKNVSLPSETMIKPPKVFGRINEQLHTPGAYVVISREDAQTLISWAMAAMTGFNHINELIGKLEKQKLEKSNVG